MCTSGVGKSKPGGGDGPDGGSSGMSSSLCTGDIGTFGSAYTGWPGIGVGPTVGGAPEGGRPEGWSVPMSSLSGPGSGLFVVACSSQNITTDHSCIEKVSDGNDRAAALEM
jgi:hypothetical protein